MVKSHHDIDRPEPCPGCGLEAVREFCPQRIHLTGTKVTHPEFNPGLGCVVKNKSHLKDLCKIKGVEEIGNESPDKIHKHFDKAREEKVERIWSEADSGWIGNGE